MTSASGEIVKEYLRKYPSSPSNHLARLIVNEVPGVFRDSEQARTAIRYYRGARGDMSRRMMAPESYLPKIDIPLSDEEDSSPYCLTYGDFPLIVGGDAHIPYHDQDAIELFVERAIEIKAKTMILAGDWIDCYQVSRFNKDPRKRSIKDEIEMVREVIGAIKKAAPQMKIIYKIGNHEDRIDHYVMNNAPALYGLESVTLPGLLKTQELEITVVNSRRMIKAGHLHIVHGHEFGMSVFSPVNVARGLYLKAKKSSLCFHHHRASSHSETAINGDRVTCWSGGCLCGLKPDYLPINNWSLGFTEVYAEDDIFSVRNREIINYRVV